MKKTLIILFCVPLFSIAQSPNDIQVQYHLNRVLFYGGQNTIQDLNGFSNELTSEQCQELSIRKVTIEHGRKKDKFTKTEYELNEAGLVAKISKEKETLNYSYEQDSLVSSIVATGKKDKLTSFEYFNGKLKKKEIYENDRLKSRILFDYGQRDKVSFCLLQNGRNLKTSYAMSYEYENQKLSRQKFVKNNRVLRVWDYSCEPKGELIDPKKLSTICSVREENNDGSYAQHVRKIEGGDVILYTHHYDKDSVNYASSCEKETGEKMWESTISKTERKYIYYSKKGHIKRTYTSKFNSEGKIVEVESIYGKKQKKMSKTMNTYNKKGLISERVSFYRGKQRYTRKYTYES